MTEQLNFKVAANIENKDDQLSICGYAYKFTHEGSSLRECTIGNRTSCEHFNNPEVAPSCFVKKGHEAYLELSNKTK